FGNIYFSDTYFNNRIRKISTTGIISTVAGNGGSFSTGDGGQATAAGLNNPYSIIFDAAGNLYISEVSVVRKVSTTGVITTIAGIIGSSGYSGDGGQATAALLKSPGGLTFDGTGNLYIADYGNSRVRKINNLGIITTVVGTGVQGSTGDGGQATTAELNTPCGLAFDAAGNLYISDYYGYRIRKVNTAGIISTFAGGPTGGFSGDGGTATSATFSYQSDISFDNIGNLYVADELNERIRRITPPLTITVNSATICAGATTTLTAGGANTYTWSPATGLSTTTGSVVIANPTVTTSYT